MQHYDGSNNNSSIQPTAAKTSSQVCFPHILPKITGMSINIQLHPSCFVWRCYHHDMLFGVYGGGCNIAKCKKESYLSKAVIHFGMILC